MSVTISGSGQIIKQVIQTVKYDAQTFSSGSYVAVSGLTASITPTNSANKILVLVQLVGSSQDNSSTQLLRNGSAIFVGNKVGANRQQASSGGLYYANSTLDVWAQPMIFLDSPATTSAVTYSVQAYTAGGTMAINQAVGDTDNIYSIRSVSSITVMEVAYA